MSRKCDVKKRRNTMSRKNDFQKKFRQNNFTYSHNDSVLNV